MNATLPPDPEPAATKAGTLCAPKEADAKKTEPAPAPTTFGTDFDSRSLRQYLKEIGRYPMMDKEEEARLAPLIRQGDKGALDKLVRANLRFVVAISKKYQGQGVPLVDLINEGNVGMLQAASKFNEKKGVKFISYAIWWVRQAILRALAEQSRIVRIPVNRAAALSRISREKAVLFQQLGRMATADEIADHLEISLGEVERTLAEAKTHLSLDAPPGSGEGNRLAEYLPDQFAPSPDEEVFERALTETLKKSLGELHVRESWGLGWYYGLYHGVPETAKVIAKVFNVTLERALLIKVSLGLPVTNEEIEEVFTREKARQIKVVLDHKVPVSCEEIGQLFGVTREKARQIKVVLDHKVPVSCEEICQLFGTARTSAHQIKMVLNGKVQVTCEEVAELFEVTRAKARPLKRILDRDLPLTHEELGQIFGVSRERALSIQKVLARDLPLTHEELGEVLGITPEMARPIKRIVDQELPQTLKEIEELFGVTREWAFPIQKVLDRKPPLILEEIEVLFTRKWTRQIKVVLDNKLQMPFDVEMPLQKIGEVFGVTRERARQIEVALDRRPPLTLNEVGEVFAVTRRRARPIKKLLNQELPLNLEDLGGVFGVTRERARQIKEKGLVRLRHKSRARFLKPFVE